MTRTHPTETRMALLTLLGSAVWLLTLALAHGAQAHPAPTAFNYQGRLTDLVGAPLPDGVVTMELALFDGETGGAAVWQETQPVEIVDGVFSATLGESTPLALDFATRYWLEITVDGDTLAPRLPLLAVPYARHAEDADSLAGHTPSDFLAADALQPALDAHAADGGAHHDPLSSGLAIQPASVDASGDITAGGAIVTGDDVDAAGSVYAGGSVVASGDVWAGSVSLQSHEHPHDHPHDHSHASLTGRGASDHHSSTSNGLNITPATVVTSGTVASGHDLYVGSTRRAYFHDMSHGNVDYLEFNDSDDYYSFRRDGGGNWANVAAGEIRAHHNGDYLRLYHDGTGSYGIIGNSNGTGIRLSASGFHPWSDLSANLGTGSRRWSNLYAQNCHCGAYIENNLMSDEVAALDDAARAALFPPGSVLVWRDGGLALSSEAGDPLVQAVAGDAGQPIVMGAEPIRVAGPVAAGDFLVTSAVEGAAMASDGYRPGLCIGQALEDFDGDGTGLIRAMIRRF